MVGVQEQVDREVSEQASIQMLARSYGNIREQVLSRMWDRIYNRVWDPVRDRIRDQMRDRVWRSESKSKGSP
jgi:hypothetical protein